MSRSFAVLFVAALLSAPAPARAQSRWREQVNAQIDQASKILTDKGFAKSDTYDGTLRNEESESLTLSLRSGRQYALVAVCDNDCSDLDLRLYDGDKEIDSDIEDDDTPVVIVAPQGDGKFRLKIIMAKCATSPCFYGVGLFSK